MRKKSFLIAGLSLFYTHCHAQMTTTPGQPNSLALQNILSARVYRFNEPTPYSLEAGTNAFFSDIEVSLDYAYQHLNSKLSDGQKSDSHTVLPGFYLEYNRNTSITASFAYSYLSGTQNAFAIAPVPVPPQSIHADSYGPMINFDQEILNFFGIDTAKNSLTFEADLAYSRTHFTADASAPPFFNNGFSGTSDTYDVGPSIIFIHPLMMAPDEKFIRLNLTVSPAYDYNIQHTTFFPEDINTGLFSALARLDYGFNSKCFLGIYGTWERIVNQDPKFVPSFSSTDWAKVGAAFVYKPCNHWLVNVGYYYEAFNSAFDSHNVTAHVEYHF